MFAQTKTVALAGIELTSFKFKVQHLNIEPPWIVSLWVSKLIHSPNVFALGFNSKQTLTLTLSFYLSELEIILGKIPSSNLKTFQFPKKKKKTVTCEGFELTTFI